MSYPITTKIRSFLARAGAGLFAVFFILPLRVYAASGDLGTGIKIPGETEAKNYSDYIKNIYNFSIKLGGILAVLMIIYAGIRYMTSQGNPSAINEAKDVLIGSLSGFAMLLLVYLILRVLNLQ